MALVPLAWLIGLVLKGQRPPSGWWWIAGAFAISAVPDSMAHRMNPWIPSAVYPIAQSAIIASVLVSPTKAFAFTLILVIASVTDTVLTAGAEPRGDWIVRTVAWLGLVSFVWAIPLPRLRLALLEAFGVGWLAWIGLLLMPGPPNAVWGSPSWRAYQAVRATSLLLFCRASLQLRPHLRVA